MRRESIHTILEDDSLPVIVPRSLRTLVPTAPGRIRRLRRHLIAVLRGMRTVTRPEFSPPPVQRQPAGFAARVVRTACTLCQGACCQNGADAGFLDVPALARMAAAQPALDARALLRYYVGRVPDSVYQGSCIFHGRHGCTLDPSSRSDVCNNYFCGGLHDYMAGDATVTPVRVIAGERGKLRTSPVLLPSKVEPVGNGGG